MIVNFKLTLERVHQNEWATFRPASTSLDHATVVGIWDSGSSFSNDIMTQIKVNFVLRNHTDLTNKNVNQRRVELVMPQATLSGDDFTYEDCNIILRWVELSCDAGNYFWKVSGGVGPFIKCSRNNTASLNDIYTHTKYTCYTIQKYQYLCRTILGRFKENKSEWDLELP